MADYRVTVDNRLGWRRWAKRFWWGRYTVETHRYDWRWRLWRFWFRVIRRMTFHRYLIHTRKFGLGG